MGEGCRRGIKSPLCRMHDADSMQSGDFKSIECSQRSRGVLDEVR